MISESEFNALAEEYLEALFCKLEEQDADAKLEIDLQDGVLTIEVEKSGQQFIVNKHVVNHEIWLSSPISGGVHFAFADRDKLVSQLMMELSQA